MWSFVGGEVMIVGGWRVVDGGRVLCRKWLFLKLLP